MIVCKHCDFECKDGEVTKFVAHVYEAHADKLDGPGFCLGHHGRCTTPVRKRRGKEWRKDIALANGEEQR